MRALLTRGSKPGLLINRNFAFLWSGQTISMLGSSIFDATVLLWVVSLTHGLIWSALAVAGIGVAASIPSLLIGPLAGVFVDRWDRRQTMIRMDTLNALLIASLFLLAILPSFPSSSVLLFIRLGMIYVVLFLQSTCMQFFGPARLALLGDIVEESQRTLAIGRLIIPMQVSGIIGAPLGAMLFTLVGLQWSMLANSLSFVVSLLALLAVHAPAYAPEQTGKPSHHVFQELFEGLQLYRLNRILRSLLITGMLFMLGGGAVNTLMVFFVSQNLHAPAAWYTILFSTFGIGALVGAGFIPALGHRVGIARLFSGSIMLWGLIMLFTAQLRTFYLAVPALFILGLANSGVNVTVHPLLLQVTPRHLIGRAETIQGSAITLVIMLSGFLAGYVNSTLLAHFHYAVFQLVLGPVNTILTAAGFIALLAGCYAAKGLRGIQLAASAPAKAPVLEEV